jgi:hypothetical protein
MFAYMLVLRVVLSLMSRYPRSAVGIYQFNYYSVMMFRHVKEHRGGMISEIIDLLSTPIPYHLSYQRYEVTKNLLSFA